MFLLATGAELNQHKKLISPPRLQIVVSLSDNDAIVFDKQRVIEVICFTLVNQLVPPP